MTAPACHYCHEPADPLELDHYPVPRRHGGTATVPACRRCHTIKDRAGWPPLDGLELGLPLAFVVIAGAALEAGRWPMNGTPADLLDLLDGTETTLGRLIAARMVADLLDAATPATAELRRKYAKGTKPVVRTITGTAIVAPGANVSLMFGRPE